MASTIIFIFELFAVLNNLESVACTVATTKQQPQTTTEPETADSAKSYRR
jgi:hypothetical protein